MTPEQIAEVMRNFREQTRIVQEKSAPEFEKFLGPLALEGERSAVILGAERVSVSVGLLLKKALLPVTQDIKKDPLFRPDAALGTFSRRIDMAYRLGYIDEDFKEALNITRNLRNSFAHASTIEMLDEQDHRDRVTALYSLVKESTCGSVNTFGEIFDLTTLKGQYLSAIMTLLMKLELVTACTNPPEVLLPAKIRYQG